MKDYVQLKDNQDFYEEIKDTNIIDIKELYELYKNEFINSCESILIENQNDFLDNFYDKMNLIIKNEYGEDIFEKNASLYLTKKQCENNFVTDTYWPMRSLCSKSLKKFSSKLNKFKDFLVNFRPHCIYDEVPLHTCGSKFIQIFEENGQNTKKKVLYVVCTGCNKCYYSNCIKMNCHYCQIDFYSEIINISNNLFSVTWKDYHCNNENILINEQMHCIICNNLLYIKNNKLFCKNCKEFFDPKTIIWTCKVCNKDFKSDIKIFNPLEFKEIELAKRDAILYKKVSKPNNLPCNCISRCEIDNYNFIHEQDGKCQGLMFYSYVNNKEFLVCSLCNKIYELIKFHWQCPICFKKFITNELRFYNYSNNNNNDKRFYKNNNTNNLINPMDHRCNSGKKINNSNSQKLFNIDIRTNRVYHKNNSYIKKRINNSYTSNNSMNTSIEKNKGTSENSMYKKKKALSIILNNDNRGNNINNTINNNNSNKENNSITNKYNIGSTMHSSHFNNNNIRQPQTARKITDSFLTKKDKFNTQNKSNINRYIDEKVLNIPFTTLNKKSNGNQNKKLYINAKPYRTIEEYINNFNCTEINKNNNYLNTTVKTLNDNDSNKNEENNYINNIKKCFKKYQKNNCRENSFCENSNKSFLSQKTDMKMNQVYVPKKHIHRSSAPTTPLYKDKNMKTYYNSIYDSNENNERNNNINNNNNYIKYEYNNKNNHYNNSCEKRNIKYININNINENSINKNIQKLRELSGPKIYPIIKKNIFIENNINDRNKNNNKSLMITQKTNNNIDNLDKKKLLNNHRNFTNIFPNFNGNNKLNTTVNSNNNAWHDNGKNKIPKNNRNNNLVRKNSKKNNYTNRNINYSNAMNNKNKGMGSVNEKCNNSILNSSVDGTNNNIQNNNNINKSFMGNNPQNNIMKRKNKNNNINNNDTILSKYRKLINKNIQSGKKDKNSLIQNNQNRNTKKIGYHEYTSSSSKPGTINKSNNNFNSSNKKKFNKNINKNSKKKEKEENNKDKEKEKELNIIQKININLNNIEKKEEKEKEEEDELKTFNFDEYRIITQLGQGSFGKIYLVQNSNNELFTMKKLVYSEELDVQTVLKEYKMCYKLKHPNVVKILGIYSNKLDKTTYVVYVLMEVGLTDWEKEIKTHIEKKLYYTEDELIQITKQIINVLSFLQKQNVSHRDIKPQNILVFKNNIYKVADFGEAKQIENMTINLACNSLRGTELYMSPLLFNGLRTGQVDIRHNVFKSDVYSLGLCILFAGSLEMMSLYDIRKYVDMADARKYLDKMFKDRYSSKLIDLLSLLLEIHENKRPDFIDLEKIIQDW